MTNAIKFDAVFLCTPQIVSSWLYYPAWLSTPGITPNCLVLDSNDLEHYQSAANSIDATPYSVLTWDTLDTYVAHRFIKAEVSYSSCVRSDLSTMRQTAERITKSLAKEQLQSITLHGYESWLRYGLEIRKQWRGKETIFLRAIENTIAEMNKVREGNLPVDPERLVMRYLLKLLVALSIRKHYAAITGIPETHLFIFDIPEYGPAVDLLIKKMGVPSSLFAIPSVSTQANGRVIAEILGIDEPSLPNWGNDIDLLHEAIDEVGQILKSGVNQEFLSKEIDAKLQEAHSKLKKKRIVYDLVIGSNLLTTAVEAARGLFGSSPVDLVLAMGSLAPLYLLMTTREKVLREELTGYSAFIRFLASREFLYPVEMKARKARIWKSHLFGIARKLLPKSLTQRHIQEEISRQMMAAWLNKPVWYDNSESPIP
ncbi:MAG: hypothetical protein HY670_10405 [Chloroflexi bacterium]|nr:hypothetical protein [Chloroflexota bacterium]